MSVGYARKPYLFDVSDEEWTLAVGYLTLTAAEVGATRLEFVKLPEANRGFVLLPRRWVVERPFAWATRCRGLVKDHERRATTLAGFHVVAFVGYVLKQAVILMQVHDTLSFSGRSRSSSLRPVGPGGDH